MARLFDKLRLIKRAISKMAYLDESLDSVMRYNVIKQQLSQRLLYSTESGVATQDGSNCEIIVSLTSHGSRIRSVIFAIESIFSQTMKPNKVVLYLGNKEFLNKKLPLSLMRQRERGLEIRYVEDIGSHTKLIPALKDFPKAIIITIDDDYMYPIDLIERLFRVHEAYPHAICCSHSRIIKRNSEGDMMPYRSFEMCFPDRDYLSFSLLAEGFGGILYPPQSLSDEVFDIENLKKYAPAADDLWFKAMELLAGTPVAQMARNRAWFQSITSEIAVQDTGLYHYNNERRGNDVQLKTLFTQYKLYDKLQ